MKSRIHATILLLVFGIIQTHSHPKGRDALHELSEFGILQDLSSEPFGNSIGSNLYEDLGDDQVDKRVRRDRKLDDSEILARLYKQGRVATLARVMANNAAARRAFEVVLEDFHRLMDGYIARGLSVEQAIEQLEIHHPTVANQVVGNENNRV